MGRSFPIKSMCLPVAFKGCDRETKLDPGGRLRVGLSSTMVAIVAIVAMAVGNWWCPIEQMDSGNWHYKRSPETVVGIAEIEN